MIAFRRTALGAFAEEWVLRTELGAEMRDERGPSRRRALARAIAIWRPEIVADYRAMRARSTPAELIAMAQVFVQSAAPEPPRRQPSVSSEAKLRIDAVLPHMLKVLEEIYGVKREQILGPLRRSDIVRVRQIGMYVACSLTTCALGEIARAFGRVHHTTVMHARDVIESEVRDDAVFGEHLREVANLTHKRAVAALTLQLSAYNRIAS